MGGIKVVAAAEASIEDKRTPPSVQTQARRWPPNLVVTRAATLITTRRRLAAVLLPRSAKSRRRELHEHLPVFCAPSRRSDTPD
jgi:hypothetical protein